MTTFDPGFIQKSVRKRLFTGYRGSNVDITGTPVDRLVPEDSNPGKVTISAGGVGRNVAENIAKLGISVKLLSE